MRLYKESCAKAFGTWVKSLAVGIAFCFFTSVLMARLGFVIDVGAYQSESGPFAKTAT